MSDQRVDALISELRVNADDSLAWEVRAVCDELSKGGKHDEAINLGENALVFLPTFEPLGTCLAWAYFRRDVRGVDKDSDGRKLSSARSAHERILQLPTGDPYGRFSPIPLTTIQVAKALVGRSPSQAVNLLERLNPDYLSTESDQYRSLYSQWFTLFAKALVDARQWSAALDLSALVGNNPNLSRSDVESIQWNRVRALEAVGKTEEALDLLAVLRRSRSEWWFDACHARLSETLGSTDRAVFYARCALSHSGDIAPRWATIAQLGRLLYEDDPSLANDHLRTAQALRTARGWKADPDLEELMRARGVDRIDQTDLSERIARLRDGWNVVEEETRSSGTVSRVLAGGGSGFIAIDDGGSVYFSMGRNGGEAPPVGTRVSFRVSTGFDQKKQRSSTRAIQVQPIAE